MDNCGVVLTTGRGVVAGGAALWQPTIKAERATAVAIKREDMVKNSRLGLPGPLPQQNL